MIPLPEHFQESEIHVVSDEFGEIGNVIGFLYHYPHWIGLLKYDDNIREIKNDLLQYFNKNSLVVYITDNNNGAEWKGMASDLRPPYQGYPWFELYWRDDRNPRHLFKHLNNEGLLKKIERVIWRLVAGSR